MNNLIIEWSGDSCLNDLVKKKNKKLGLRVYKTKKEYSLSSISDKLIAFTGLALSVSDSKILKIFIGFLFLLSVSPFEFKIMKGKGIDSIIDSLEFDSENQHLFIEEIVIEKKLYELDIGMSSLSWFLEKKLFEKRDNVFIFTGNRITSAKIYQSLD